MSWTDANLTGDLVVPDDFSDAYYQTAPPDQQISEFVAGDLIAVVNMHPDIATLRFTLPNVRAAALAQTSRGDRYPFALRPDHIHIEPDRLRVEIVYRGTIVLPEEGLDRTRIAAMLEDAQSPASFPDLSTLSGLIALPAAPSDGRGDFGSTAVLDPEPTRPLGSNLVSGFGGDKPAQNQFTGTQVLEADPALTGASAARPVPAAPPPPIAGPARGFSGTVVMGPDDPAPATASPPHRAAPARRGAPPPQAESKFASTMVIDDEEALAPHSLPFQGQLRGTPNVEGEGGANLPGAPWAGESASPVQPAQPNLMSTMAVESTFDLAELDEEETVSRASDVGEPASAVEPPKVEVSEKPASEPPRAAPKPPEPPPEPEPPPVKPPAPAPAPRAFVASDLYKRFKR